MELERGGGGLHGPEANQDLVPAFQRSLPVQGARLFWAWEETSREKGKRARTYRNTSSVFCVPVLTRS